MALPYDPNNREQQFNQAALGGQDFLRICSAASPGHPYLQAAYVSPVPAGQENLIGQPLLGASLTANGTYLCSFPLNGMSSVETHIKATFGGGTTVTTSGYTTYADSQTSKQAFTGMGALTTVTQQDATPALASPKGEGVGVVSIVVGSISGSVTFSVAEYNGQRG